jgi:pyrimidine-specific ribonucleoside hydrolase
MQEPRGPSTRRVVLDVDTGIDDALALLYAVASPQLDLCGVTTVSGNVSAGLAARNSASVLARCGAGSVPIAVGASATTAGRGPREGPTDHGADGLGGVSVPQSTRTIGSRPSNLVRTVAAAGPVTLVGLAPMTNLAALAQSADALVLVGGELLAGGEPDLNAGHDPDATASVLRAEVPTTLYVVDVFERVRVAPEDIERLRSSRVPRAQLAGELLAARRAHLVGDSGALVVLARPDLFHIEPHRVGLVDGRLTRTPAGRLLDVVVDVDARAAAADFVDVLLSGERRATQPGS